MHQYDSNFLKTIRVLFVLVTANLLHGCSDDAQEKLSPEQKQFKATLLKFSGQRYALVQKMSTELNLTIPPQIHRFFKAALSGDEKGVAKLCRSFWEEKDGYRTPDLHNALWPPIHETIYAYDTWTSWKKDVGLLKLFYEPILSVMPPGSIYFGGTTPGRFLITLMNDTGSSNVFCLTQNWLADYTYIDYLRFIYGEHIWIPPAEDSAKAYQEYVADAQARGLPEEMGVKIDHERNRVSVTGTRALMNINGIVIRWIFEHNKDKHEFYVAESYEMDWMYPFLEPCGLIMKLTPTAKITEEVIAQDMVFWENHIELLEQQPGFADNPEARTAFAHARAAIAGLYQYHKMYEEATTAYRQALRIDPTSVSATTRFSAMQQAIRATP